MNKVDIKTEDGICPAYEFRPSQPSQDYFADGDAPWPGVLMFMDGLAIRPVLFQMAQRLANGGYFVLLPDLFYRAGPYEPFDAARVFTDEAYRKDVLGKYFTSTSNAKAAVDTRAFLAHMVASKDVRKGLLGTHGYCMGGGMAITAAGTFPDRFAAAASFHGGRLATDVPDSPHLLSSRLKARVYIGSAVEDESFPPEQAAKLKDVLDKAEVAYRMETYEGARHGWTMSDVPVYHPEAAERHWEALFDLYQETLR
ncbi:MAG TPA: dienelactone hydrolase family protein [Candidatus Xenobia bacterium]|jgi:carboxymethylenebutenolidase